MGVEQLYEKCLRDGRPMHDEGLWKLEKYGRPPPAGARSPLVVRVYRCRECGYVELRDGDVGWKADAA